MSPKIISGAKVNLRIREGKQEDILNYFMSTQIQIKFSKSHILQSHQFQGCYRTPPHKNLVPEIKKLPLDQRDEGIFPSRRTPVDAKSALNANHTASRTKLASHAQRANDVPVNFS
jgi:hypothetical protein